ncbi:YjjG family noncanonical pyrimidine nucleotidase [Calidifontibacillus oryziterrae]|uniref:YjjG family noncanonical pyrimidine nucleotidase n=1 Tax=Calidifontibacillus oryziterrae TaxID=1191699 RepID=UPI0002FC4E03|nr:YjjG family noncanonical pyrimidine nucleotidase [Calidifontibacillus oryziterrae]
MKKYKTLLFDADDTLLDFGTTESFALRKLFEEQNMTLTQEIELHYKQLNKRLWKSFEEGKLTREEVVNSRFTILFSEYNQKVDGVILEGAYRTYLDQGHHLVEGALQLLTRLQNDFDLYVVTNGVSKTQHKRLRDSGISPLLKGIFVSEDAGFQKPRREFFDYVFTRIVNFSSDQTMIIGDSLHADIKGGNLAGIDTCWFNPDKNQNDSDINPTYQIQKLADLYQILI